MDTTDLNGRAVLITGAGSGIGRATAIECARRRARLFLCDVDDAGLAATAAACTGAGGVTTRHVDVAQREAMAAFATAVHAEVPAVDLLVNNAGVGLGGGFLHTSLDDWDWIVGINLLGVVHGCHFFLPAMVQRGTGGHVVNLSSTAGYAASQLLVAYSATKFAVLGLSEALRDELAPHRIGVTAVCPGIINTAITSSSPMRGPAADQRQRVVDAYRRRNYPPERVALNILRAVHRNRAVAPVAPEAWGFYYLKRLSPALLARVGRWLAARSLR